MVRFDHDDTVVGDLVEAEWLLHHNLTPEPTVMHTVGWIRETNEQWITLAQERSEAGLTNRFTTVLRTALVTVMRLQKVRE